MNGSGVYLTEFALTSIETSDGGRFTRQFLRGTRATSAVDGGFLLLGAIVKGCADSEGFRKVGIDR